MSKTEVDNVEFFLPVQVRNKRGHNSTRDKRLRRDARHPACTPRRKHGRVRGR